MSSAAYAMFSRSIPLPDVMRTLSRGGFQKESICMMLSPTHPIAATVREANTRPYERDSNASMADVIGWLSEFGAVLIPTFGFFIRSRSYCRALLTESDSMSKNGRCGPLVGLGFSEDEAAQFERKVRDVGALLYVSCPEESQTLSALELLRATGAQQTGTLQNEARTAAVA
jgi:hypothetical protein